MATRFAAAAFFLWWTLVVVDGRYSTSPTSVARNQRSIHALKPAFIPRGGATLADEYEYDSEEYDEYDEESEDEEEAAAALAAAAKAKAAAKASKAKAKAAALSASAVKATAKAKSKKAAKVKESVSVKLASKPNKKSFLQALHVPYIVRACLNPLTVLAMTRAYFASLFNISYLEEESSQPLRSALEEKAKKAGSTGTGGRKGKRAMRPGQAKTLSDLPQLSA